MEFGGEDNDDSRGNIIYMDTHNIFDMRNIISIKSNP